MVHSPLTKKSSATLLLIIFFLSPITIRSQSTANRWAIVIHGGASNANDCKTNDPAREAAQRAGLRAALQAGADSLTRGGLALDAVEIAVRVMEDDPVFNAGRGAVFTADGKNELDASIMNGATMQAGAVAGVTRTRHPISLARAVMEHSPHVMLSGAGADTFAQERGLEQVAPSYFFTEFRWQALITQLRREGRPLPPRPAGVPSAPAPPAAARPVADEGQFGTVGVVVLDRLGNLAAGTSTGGTQAKRWGRIGDSPIIGAGTYASNTSCAVSGTGTGEYFIRLTIAREVCALVQYQKLPLQPAADEVIQKRLTSLKGDGGAIAITPDGQMAWSFNTAGMNRARLAEGGEPQISVCKDEP